MNIAPPPAVVPLLDTQDDPFRADPWVLTAPYNLPVQLGELLAPAIEAWLTANLPALLEPLVQPAADAAVANIALLRAGDLATGPIQTTRILAQLGNEFVTKDFAETLVAGGAATTVITDGLTVHGDGTAGAPVALITSIFGTGLNWAGNSLTLAQSTQALLGGAQISSPAKIGTGTDDATIISPLGLRSQLGANVTTLTTAVKTIVPAINEIEGKLALLSGVVVYAGSYNGTTHSGTFNGHGGIGAGTGPMPAAAVANQGAYLIVTVAGPGGGTNEPPGPLEVGDWLISSGTVWDRLDFNTAAMTAANVAVNPAVLGQTNVQAALTSLAAAAVVVSDTPPAGARVNTLWWCSADGQMYILYDDGTSQQWVRASHG